VPYPNVFGLALSPAIREAAEPVVSAGIDRANCVVDATNIKRRECRNERAEQPLSYYLPATVTLPRIYRNSSR